VAEFRLPPWTRVGSSGIRGFAGLRREGWILPTNEKPTYQSNPWRWVLGLMLRNLRYKPFCPENTHTPRIHLQHVTSKLIWVENLIGAFINGLCRFVKFIFASMLTGVGLSSNFKKWNRSSSLPLVVGHPMRRSAATLAVSSFLRFLSR
jgi:hypothetical protein